ncbi:hypothetical protein TNCV_3433851 [Trichonephila clavipes]|nr:hypothetical protein TNCV_3433851 [Trichonephila clavipes]
MKILARTIKYYTITIESIKESNMRSLKLHGLNDEDCHISEEHLKDSTTTPPPNALTLAKRKRPIGYWLKDCKEKPEDIEKEDLIDLDSRVIGFPSSGKREITNQPLPVFLVSLPRNMTNANIFKLR